MLAVIHLGIGGKSLFEALVSIARVSWVSLGQQNDKEWSTTDL